MVIIATWNIKEGNDPEKVSKVVKRLYALYPFDALYLHEAKGVRGKLDLPGFFVDQLPSEKSPINAKPENANTAVIYPKMMKRHEVYNLKMKLRWRGPKLGIKHEPRMYRWFKPFLERKTWKSGGGHFPFGEAQEESFKKIRWWFLKTVPGRPTVFAADFNAKPAEILKKLKVKYARAWGPDGFAYKNCKLVKTVVVGMHRLGFDHDSDHPPVVGIFK